MELYVGLDVSLEETSICVVDKTGIIRCESKVISNTDAIASFVGTKMPGVVLIGLETGRAAVTEGPAPKAPPPGKRRWSPGGRNR